MRWRRRGAVAGCAAGLVVLLGACTSTTAPIDPGATTGPTSTATTGSGPSTIAPAATTSTAAPTTGTAGTGTYPTDVPAAARANTNEGAQEFVKHYISLINDAFTTPKNGLLAPLALPSCKACAANEQEALGFEVDHRRYDGPPLSVLEVAIDPADQFQTGARLVDASVRQNAAHIVDAKNNVVSDIGVREAVIVFTVRRVGDQWAVAEMQVSG